MVVCVVWAFLMALAASTLRRLFPSAERGERADSDVLRGQARVGPSDRWYKLSREARGHNASQQ
jgi:hypothetical protein